MGSSNRSSNGVKGETIGLGRELDFRADVEEGKVTGDEMVGNPSSDVLADASMLIPSYREARSHTRTSICPLRMYLVSSKV